MAKKKIQSNVYASGGTANQVNPVGNYIAAGANIGTNMIQNIMGDKPTAPDAPQYTTANDAESLFALGQEYKDINLGRKGFLSGLTGGLQGAAAGAIAGPWGAVAGGAGGLFSGIFGAAKYNRRAKREEAKYRTNAGNNFSAQNNVIQSNAVSDTLMNYAAYGGQFDNGLTEFNEGGLHESNPNGGVPQGIGENGMPNVVEEGETKFDDYIFSNRLGFNLLSPDEYKLPKALKNKSFAQASKYLAEESKERPYDPISKRGLEADLNKLRDAQEEMKEIDNIDMQNQELLDALGLGEQVYAKGGGIHIKKSKRGTFTAAAKKRGMGVQAFARKVLANKDNYSSAMVKKANFARNASKWKHAFGGELFDNINGYASGGVMWRPTNNRFVILDGKVNKFALGAPINVRYPKNSYAPGFVDAPVDPPVYGTTNNRAKSSYSVAAPPVQRIMPNVQPVGALGIPINSGYNIALPTYTSADYQRAVDNSNNMAASTSVDTNMYQGNAANNRFAGALRYAPILTNLGLTLSDMVENPETVRLQRIATPRRGRYAQMEYFDRTPMVAAINRRANTTTDTLRNASAGNRATFMANAALVGNRAQESVGDLLLKIREDESNRRLRTLGFNNQVDNIYNQQRMYADRYNSGLDMQEQQINAANKAARRNAIREGLSTIGSELGQIGMEKLNRYQAGFMFGYDPITGQPLYRDARVKGGKISKKRK